MDARHRGCTYDPSLDIEETRIVPLAHLLTSAEEVVGEPVECQARGYIQ